jgi:hypothetical protein
MVESVTCKPEMRTWNRTETSAEQPRKGFDWILAPDRHPCARTLEIVVPYIGSELTGRVMERAAVLAAGLNVALKLVAVYVAPYPADLDCPAATKEHLTSRLTELRERSSLPSSVELVVARDRSEGLRQVLPPGSTVLLGSRRRWWRTPEERLARALTHQGHRVSLIHFE